LQRKARQVNKPKMWRKKLKMILTGFEPWTNDTATWDYYG